MSAMALVFTQARGERLRRFEVLPRVFSRLDPGGCSRGYGCKRRWLQQRIAPTHRHAAFMAMPVPNPTSGGPQWFATTHWSVVLAAKSGESSQSRAAMEKLCRTYWSPVFAFIRRDGHDSSDAQDLTQDFFARLLERDYLGRLVHQRGKFRSFLLTFLKHFLSEQRRKAGAQKRGGGQVFVPLDATDNEARYLNEAVDHLTPDEVFERRWAQSVMQTALNRLRAEYAARNQTELFDLLQNHQLRDSSGSSHAQIGAKLGMTEPAIKSAVHRMRQRHRELLREEIAQTVTRPEEIEDELRHFRALLSS
jgi:RNA polymerase sigma factor (sigma-70 family)